MEKRKGGVRIRGWGVEVKIPGERKRERKKEENERYLSPSLLIWQKYLHEEDVQLEVGGGGDGMPVGISARHRISRNRETMLPIVCKITCPRTPQGVF
ncbi:hypothetical protein CEXT_421831 [Caerostris extrusa]|uniref:Uncharacterized protein n=1 Tax=Caerostris extrusa TaxID=172846 RepID=A0AAV4UIK8_CAEEX|nr:hypothetical protein CEXT_421831 [Caerostris extrusa]